MKKQLFNKILLVSFLASCISSCTVGPIKTESSVELIKKSYKIHNTNINNADSFRALNNVIYPSNEKEHNQLDINYVDAIKSFSRNIYLKNYATENFSFSPFGLYSNLDLMSLSTDNQEVLLALDNVLGVNTQTRRTNYPLTYKNNFYLNGEYGTMQLYNGVFLNSSYEANETYINSLSSYFTEAFSVNFANDSAVSKMLQWIDQKINEKNFLRKEDFEINTYSMMYIVNTLYFRNRWLSMYNEKESKQDVFYLDSGTKNATYMNHTVYSDLYDYDKYVSCYDAYQNGYKIQYIVPKDTKDDICELIKDVDFLHEDESHLSTYKLIDLYVPKFTSEIKINFSNTLKQIGLNSLFEGKVFNYVFDNLPENMEINLSFVKQKNKIEFNEDGTEIKSVTFSGMKATSAAPIDLETYVVKLNQPFVYVIYDESDIPIYIGKLNNI